MDLSGPGIDVKLKERKKEKKERKKEMVKTSIGLVSFHFPSHCFIVKYQKTYTYIHIHIHM
jgi:hypothetical protein